MCVALTVRYQCRTMCTARRRKRKGKRIVLKVNGKTRVDYTEPEDPVRSPKRKERLLSEGRLAIQGRDPGSKVCFRSIRVKPLPDCASVRATRARHR